MFLIQAMAEKTGKGLTVQISELNKKISEANLQVNDLEMSNKKTQAENSDLLRQLEQLDQSVSMLQKSRLQLNTELEDVKKHCEEEVAKRGFAPMGTSCEWRWTSPRM